MDKIVAARLDHREKNVHFDAEFSKKIGQTARDYLDAGIGALNYATADFDAASDLVDMLAPISGGSDAYAKLDRTSALAFRHPLTFTEMATLTCAVAQILFGGEQARSVEAQGPDDDDAAESVNALLAWNDGRLNIYMQGWLWVWAALVYNRGVWFESEDREMKLKKEEVEEEDITAESIPLTSDAGVPLKDDKGDQIMVKPKRKRLRNKRTYSGFYNRLDLVSPYDFICDPALPLTRFQEGRFAGHRVMIPWHELKRRSELDPEDDQYVLPHVVDKIKTQKGASQTPVGAAQGAQNTSRTFFERTARMAANAGVAGTGGIAPSSDAVNKDDGGIVECFAMTIRAKPKTLGMFDDEETELISILITNMADVLSANVRPNNHDEFPYAVGEARPNAHRQFGPSMALAIKNVQDHVDALNNTHTKAQARMGNIIGVDPTKCDTSNLLAPDKHGLLITKTEQGRGSSWDDILTQIKLTDTTAGYPDEMELWVKTAENTTGAHAQVQGQTDDPSQTATQFEGVQEMAMGRITSIARLLSEQAVCPQTKRWYKNFAQFMPESQLVRVLGKGKKFNPDVAIEKFKTIAREDIQGEYTVVPHDGSIPGANAKKVAAASRAIEASQNPALAAVFDVTLPGALDPTKILRDLLEESGLNVQEYSVTAEQARVNQAARAQAMAASGGAPPGEAPPAPGGAPVPMEPTGAGNIPSAEQLPPTPTAEPPPPGPAAI